MTSNRTSPLLHRFPSWSVNASTSSQSWSISPLVAGDKLSAILRPSLAISLAAVWPENNTVHIHILAYDYDDDDYD